MWNRSYDIVVIGGGIGGLVCGCVLAQSKFRVLIIEKSKRPGGYCISIKTQGYHFDAFVHSIGDLGEKGQLRRLLLRLNILERLDIVRSNPSDVVITPEHKISFWNNLTDTVNDFLKAFPNESKKIEKFFYDIVQKDNLNAVISFRGKSFEELLDEIFEDCKLKKILGATILGNLGVTCSSLNAFAGIKYYSQFMLDGGYCFEGGVQNFPNTLVKRFNELGGEIEFGEKVSQILIKNGKAEGVVLEKGAVIQARIIVSNCDLLQTFLDLVGKEYLNDSFAGYLLNMKPALSLFNVYLGLKQNCQQLIDKVNCWFISNYEFDKNYSEPIDGLLEEINYMYIRADYKRKNCALLVPAPFKSLGFWKDKRDEYMDKIIGQASLAVPDLTNLVEVKFAVTPQALRNWTLNSYGSPYGWALTSQQFMEHAFLRDNIIKNLFIAGHWSTIAIGVAGVAIVGERVADIIIKRLKCQTSSVYQSQS